MSQDKKSQEPKTSVLFQRLFSANELDSFLKGDLQGVFIPPFCEHITALARERGEVSERIIRRAGLERSYGHQLFSGIRKPSRDTVLQLAFGFEMDAQGTQRLLRAAGKSALYPKHKRDAAIAFCLQKAVPLLEAQEMLDSLGLTPMGSVKNYE